MSGDLPLHEIFGISEDKEKKISKEVTRILLEQETIPNGIRNLTKVYDAETVFVGVKLFQLLVLNEEATKKKNALKGAILESELRTQNAPLN